MQNPQALSRYSRDRVLHEAPVPYSQDRAIGSTDDDRQ